ncbi:MAG: hypothetical protein ACKOHK_15135 [Planctomycetia bacterium]
MLSWSFIIVSICLDGVPAEARARADEDQPVDIAALTAEARRAGLRLIESDHLVLATDRPAREGDGVGDLPRIVDQAWESWCGHFGLDPKAHRDWRAFGCLIVDRERFRTAGLLPDDLPDFVNGFCNRHRFWMHDQSNPAYRRHLLLHEAAHAFTITLRSLDTPPWYTEGIAEFLATHRLDDAGRFVPAPLPPRAGDVEQLGRIEKLRGLRAAGTCPGLDDVFATPVANHRDLSAYAASWAAVTALSLHPHHARAFAAAERGPLDAAFTTRLTGSRDWDAARAARDFDAFTDEVDYGYDFARSWIDWSPAEPLAAGRSLAVASDRGWQHAGWSLSKGAEYRVAATGRCTLGRIDLEPSKRLEAGPSVTLETEADGISLRWYRGRPLGRLLVAQWVERPEDGGRPRFVVLAAGARGTFTAAVDGAVYCKLNEPPGELADNAGRLTVTLQPE